MDRRGGLLELLMATTLVLPISSSLAAQLGDPALDSSKLVSVENDLDLQAQ